MKQRYIRIDTTKPFSLTAEIRELLAKSGWVASLWHADDVQSVRPDLTSEQSMQVLDQVMRCHDAGSGINWDVIECHADELFPEPETGEPECSPAIDNNPPARSREE